MQPGSEAFESADRLELDSLANAAADELVVAHARSLERAVAREFERQTRRTPFANTARVAALATALLRNLGEDLLNDLLMIADRPCPRPDGPVPGLQESASVKARWAMRRLSEALVEGADVLEEAAPVTMRTSIAHALQICRVDFEWRCRTALGLPSPTGGEESDLFDRAGIW